MCTSLGPAPALGAATPATARRGATKKYQLTQPMRPSPPATTIQSVPDIESSTERTVHTPRRYSNIPPPPISTPLQRAKKSGSAEKAGSVLQNGRICSVWAERSLHGIMKRLLCCEWRGAVRRFTVLDRGGADPVASASSVYDPRSRF